MKTNNERHLFNVLICVSILLSFTLGCKQIAEQMAKKGGGSGGNTYPKVTPSDKTTGSTGGEHGLSKKTNLYISDCFNKYSNTRSNFL